VTVPVGSSVALNASANSTDGVLTYKWVSLGGCYTADFNDDAVADTVVSIDDGVAFQVRLSSKS